MQKQTRAIAFVALVGLPFAGFSETATTTVPVSATVVSACNVSALPLAFGNYNPTADTATDATTTLTLECTLDQVYQVRLGQGLNGTSVTARKMVRGSGAETLEYSLYRDSARSQVWGITDTLNTLSAIGTGGTQTHTIYGRIPAGAVVPAGSYTDTVSVTVDY